MGISAIDTRVDAAANEEAARTPRRKKWSSPGDDSLVIREKVPAGIPAGETKNSPTARSLSGMECIFVRHKFGASLQSHIPITACHCCSHAGAMHDPSG
jgi:hypothetical protein